MTTMTTMTTNEADPVIVHEWESDFPPGLLTMVRAHLDDLVPIPTGPGQTPTSTTEGLGIHVGALFFLATHADVENLRVLAVPIIDGVIMGEFIGFFLLRMDGQTLVLCPDGEVDLGDGLKLVAFPVMKMSPCYQERGGRAGSHRRLNKAKRTRKRLPAIGLGPEEVSFARPKTLKDRPRRRSVIEERPVRLGRTLRKRQLN